MRCVSSTDFANSHFSRIVVNLESARLTLTPTHLCLYEMATKAKVTIDRFYGPTICDGHDDSTSREM